MFCEKCGAKLEDGSVFCEKCGARLDGSEEKTADEAQGAGYAENRGAGYANAAQPGTQNGSGGNFRAGQFDRRMDTADMTGILKRFFRDPIGAIGECGRKDYSLQGIIFLLCKDLFIALLFAVFKNIIANYVVTGFYWMYNISAPLTFIIIFVMLIIGDGAWIAMCIGVRKVINKAYDPKKMIGVVALGQVYTPAVIIVGMMLLAAFSYVGSSIAFLAGIMAMSFLQYECIRANSAESEKTRILYGAAIAAFIYAILWVVMITIAENVYSYYGFY